MEAADPLIIELDRVSFFAPYRDRRFEVGKDFPAIGSLNDPERQFRHAYLEFRWMRIRN
jgi:hypothetical protein